VWKHAVDRGWQPKGARTNRGPGWKAAQHRVVGAPLPPSSGITIALAAVLGKPLAVPDGRLTAK
jgi:hypothetical protein